MKQMCTVQFASGNCKSVRMHRSSYLCGISCSGIDLITIYKIITLHRIDAYVCLLIELMDYRTWIEFSGIRPCQCEIYCDVDVFLPQFSEQHEFHQHS